MSGKTIKVNPFLWQRHIDHDAVAAEVERHHLFDYLSKLIENKASQNDLEGASAAIQKLFDICDSAALSDYIAYRHRLIIRLNIASAISSAAFMVAHFAGIPTYFQAALAISAISLFLGAIWVKHRTPSVLRRIDNLYPLRKAMMLKEYLASLGYEAEVVQDH